MLLKIPLAPVLVFCIPISLCTILHNQRPIDTFVCRNALYFDYLLQSVSVQINYVSDSADTILSINRYAALMSCLQSRDEITTTTAFRIPTVILLEFNGAIRGHKGRHGYF